ncbi:MAG TPA: enoyl-CoA hydratase [Rhizobiales bacterium]|nr:2,3-dehydroadipyl-CoA hydratase [bacterium BMS3Bbin10]HDO51481.1 enoyl-CoA hydratase [Hyphomicrobiales bacterium]
MSVAELLIERDGPVAVLTLNRPEKRNALTFPMYEGLADFSRSAAQDDDLKVIILRGAGEKAFAAGTDISQFRDFEGAEDGLAYEKKIDGVLCDIEACPRPIIAAITGACTGGGAAIAGLCDVRLATRDMRFGFPIARTLGNCLSVPSLRRMSALLGAARTREVIMTSRLIEAGEALGIGLVSEVFDDADALFARARELAQEIAAFAPLTLRATKEMFRRMSAAEPAIEDDDLIAMCYASDDFREGLDAFLAKRKANWSGR